MTVLQHIERSSFGAPTPEELEHDRIAREHFLKYCDSTKCIRGREYAASSRANWHEGPCCDCAFNPYVMAARKEGTE